MAFVGLYGVGASVLDKLPHHSMFHSGDMHVTTEHLGDPSPGHKKRLHIYLPGEMGAPYEERMYEEGMPLKHTDFPREKVMYAFWGVFANVSDLLTHSLRTGHVLTVSASTFKTDPLPGETKVLYVLEFSGTTKEAVAFSDEQELRNDVQLLLRDLQATLAAEQQLQHAAASRTDQF